MHIFVSDGELLFQSTNAKKCYHIKTVGLLGANSRKLKVSHWKWALSITMNPPACYKLKPLKILI